MLTEIVFQNGIALLSTKYITSIALKLNGNTLNTLLCLQVFYLSE